MKNLAVFDIDGTLIRWQLYHASADSLVKLGFVNAAEYEAIKNARRAWKRREEGATFKSYEQKLVDGYNSMLLNLTTEQFEQAAEAVFSEYKDQSYTYTRDLIKKLKAGGYLLFAISGSQAEIIAKIAKHWGFDDFKASEFERADGHFTGKVTHYLAKKDEALAELIKKHGASQTGSIAVGDSLSDVKILEAVERPIAFNPEKELFDYARLRGWRIVIERKNMIYELESKSGRYLLAETN
jgi:HAD superfamily hydrolase (TIGR01490 family)